ncbi:nuclease-related domain-containing protein [Planococcus sp. X10-3]|uniref:nuclease-related domain-containing protein n=1 Tax=Planococcus sp. X10-3 TaxID=3061240 RepID=UPI003BAF2541
MHLIGRLHEKHPQKEYLENQHHRKSAGERGESKLQKKFKEFHLDEDYHALWDIGLKQGEWITQFDGLLLTDKCIIILESKNISDDLHFEEKTGEFIRTNPKGERLILENPVFQLNKNIRFLRQWFMQRKLDIAVKGLIVFTAGNCIFHSKPAGASLCKTYQMNEYLYKVLQSTPQDSAPLKINKIKRMIEANHTPYARKPLCDTYQISYDDLTKGIFCPNCRGYQMERSKRNWICRDCKTKNATAHHFALQEYFTFVNDSITNKELRAFCLIESAATANRILMKYDFLISGENKARQYRIKE